jgi:hypothetical protein
MYNRHLTARLRLAIDGNIDGIFKQARDGATLLLINPCPAQVTSAYPV